MKRSDGRLDDKMRKVKITKYFQHGPDGSVLVEFGNTKVICAATIENRVPHFLRGTGTGWIRAEYSLLPSATLIRTQREATRGKLSGRTEEIQRLIGRSLRAVLNTKALGEKTIIVDCDVIEADGSTRTAAITGAFIAVVLALSDVYERGTVFPVTDFLAAVSVGIAENDEIILDLSYEEDSKAKVDMNIVMTGSGTLVEIQGTGEKRPFHKKELEKLLSYAEKGIDELISYQKDVLGNKIVWNIGRLA